jgi:hypothetical protein
MLRITRDGGHASAFDWDGRFASSILRLLFLDRAGESAAKALRFAPRLTNPSTKASEPGCDVNDDEGDHGYCPALTINRLI